MVFHTIQPTPGLDAARRRRANREGPPAAAVRSGYQSLLLAAGFSDIQARDDTDEYRATQLRWIAATKDHEKEMRAAMGDKAFDNRLRKRETTLQAINEGLLARTYYCAKR